MSESGERIKGAEGRFTLSRALNRDGLLVDDAILHAKAGDSDALHFLYVRYADDVLSYVRRFVKDHHEAEDITQTVFAKVMKAIGRYEPREVPFQAWILRVARNAALDHLRSRRAIPCEEVRTTDESHEQHRHRTAPQPPRRAGPPARSTARGADPPSHRRALAGRDRHRARQDRGRDRRPAPPGTGQPEGGPARARRRAGHGARPVAPAPGTTGSRGSARPRGRSRDPRRSRAPRARAGARPARSARRPPERTSPRRRCPR